MHRWDIPPWQGRVRKLESGWLRGPGRWAPITHQWMVMTSFVPQPPVGGAPKDSNARQKLIQGTETCRHAELRSPICKPFRKLPI